MEYDALTMGHKTAKVPPYNTVPGSALPIVEL